MNELLEMSREWLAATGEIGRFLTGVMREVFGLRVFRFFGEALRQSGILIVGSTMVIVATVFIFGLTCGIEGAYFTQAQGVPDAAGIFTAWCNLREADPLIFGYIMAAKIGTGIVAELGAMRISEEIDALEVMGVDSLTFLCATRLLAAWIVLPFMYVVALASAFLASYIAVVHQVASVSSGGYLLVFWQYQNPVDFLYSLTKAMTMATTVVLVACYYGYNASGGPVGVGQATAKSMVLNLVLVNFIGMVGTQIFWGTEVRSPDRRVGAPRTVTFSGRTRRAVRPNAPRNSAPRLRVCGACRDRVGRGRAHRQRGVHAGQAGRGCQPVDYGELRVER